MDNSAFSIRAVLLGLLVGLLVLPASFIFEHLMFPPGSATKPQWFVWLRQFGSILNFLPGAVTGYFATRGPFRHGLVLAVGTTLLAVIAAAALLGEFPARGVTQTLYFVGFVVAVVPSVAGAWVGILYRRDRKSP